MKESKYVRTKIVAGYLLLLAAGLFAVHQVWRETEDLSAPDPYEEQLQHRHSAALQTLYRLYRAEGTSLLMLFGGPGYEREYRAGMREVRRSIDSLRALATDSVQAARLDTVVSLIAVKESRLIALKRDLENGTGDRMLARNIGEVIPAGGAAPDSLVTGEYYRCDTIVTPRPKRRFFRRLADLFSPPKEVDSSIVVASHMRADTASLRLSDTISDVLRKLEEGVSVEQRTLREQVNRERQRLARDNRKIDDQIFRFLSDYERDEAVHLAGRVDKMTLRRREASDKMGRIALGAVVLVLLFTLVLWRDINRSNRYKRELERADRDKAELLALREKLMLAVTHDFRAPLGTILGYTDLLSRLARGKREGFYLDNIRSSSEHLSALVESLLDLWRLDARKTDIQCVRFHPVRFFREICGAHRPAAAEKGIALRFETGAGEEETRTGDPVRIRQIVDNLLSNALKFTERGEVVLRLSLESGKLFFSVSDTGRGMTREECTRIFREFERLGSAEGVAGFGLGLSIVDRVVRLLGGSVAVDSVPGKGSRFLVTLPLSDLGPEEEEAPALPRLRVLLVDDDRLQLEMTAAMCRNLGLDPVVCEHPEYAAEWASGERFDLVLTDLQMPSLDGVQLLERLRGAGCEVPVAVVSARVENDGELKKRGFAARLRKPFSQRELYETVCGICPGSRVEPVAGEITGDGFDALTAFAAGDRAAEREILTSFVSQAEEEGGRLERALADGDGQEAKRLSHKLLPLFRLLKREAVVGTLEALEAGGSCSEEELRRLFEGLRESADEARRRVAENE